MKLDPKPPQEHTFEITHDGTMRYGTDGTVIVAVPQSDESKMFKRTGVKMDVQNHVNGISQAEKERQTWLVTELEGVRCYVKRVNGHVHILMTKQDMYP